MILQKPNTSSNHSYKKMFFGVLFGFFLADVILLLFRVQALLKPEHLPSLFRLALSGVFLYSTIGLVYLLFMLFIMLINKLLHLRLNTTFLAIITLIFGPLFLIIQRFLQKKILGWYISLGSPMFFVPTAISLIILVAILFLITLVFRRHIQAPLAIQRIFSYPLIIVLSISLFIFFALLSGKRTNVLGVFDADEERFAEMERSVETSRPAKTDAPNFIVLAIECFRADEFNEENCPFLWQLAQNNVCFSRYFVTAPATRPSVTSFFTSLYPIQHGCYNLALSRVDRDNVATVRVSEVVEALPAIFQNKGYRTLMVTPNTVCMDPVFGFENVFYRFDAIEPYRFVFPSFEPFYGFRFLRRNLGYFRLFKAVVFSPEHSSSYFDAPRLNKTVKREMSEKNDKPLFLYVHYMEPHSPYYDHPYKPVQLNIYSPGQRDRIFESYESEIQAVDRAVEDLFDFLDRQSFLDNTYVFITGDHGEEFFDHGHWGHGKQLYPESIHVPGILVLPPDKRRAMNVDTIVENIDISVTFAELAGIRVPTTWQGSSLVPLITEEDRGGLIEDQNAEWIALCQFNDGYFFMASAVVGDYQIIFKGWPDKQETLVFNLADDPKATQNLAGHGQELEATLTQLLEDSLQKLDVSSQMFRGKKEKIIDKEQLERLRALGYIH